MTPDQAADLAARTVAAMDGHDHHSCLDCPDVQAADRERVASDLAGLRDVWMHVHEPTEKWMVAHARRYADGLRRTAALYGVTE